MVTKTLKTKAKDNHGHEYAVTLRLSEGPVGSFGPGLEHLAEQYTHRWVLHIDKTPGQWYMTDLIKGSVRHQIALDYGQNWVCTNFRAVLDEALELI